MQIKLVSPGIWQPEVERVFGSLPVKVKNTGMAVMGAMLNRHIGVTPVTAAGLAWLVVNPVGSSREFGAWVEVRRRLLDEISVQNGSFGVVPAALPLYSVLRLAVPLIEEVCRGIGLNILICEDEVEEGVGVEQYRAYAGRMEEELKRIAGSTEGYFQLFWKERAMVLASGSRQAYLRGRSPSPVPETDPVSAGMLLRVFPRFTEMPKSSYYPKPAAHAFKHKDIPRIPEGGFDGIHHTHGQEDMAEMLMSEFVNPPAVLADRLINNGYLALRRQPRREKIRDSLIIGICPHGIQTRLNMDFIKACWLDYVGRTSLLLVKSGRLRSEFHWLEGDVLGQVRSCKFFLQDLPQEWTRVPGSPDASFISRFKKELITTLGWLPEFLDTRAGFEPLPVIHQPGGGMYEAARNWAFDAWRNHRDLGLDIHLFTAIHLMVFFPVSMRKEGEATAAGRWGVLSGGFGLSDIPRANILVTWVPDKVESIGDWAFESRGRQEAWGFHQGKPVMDPMQIAEQLIRTWQRISC